MLQVLTMKLADKTRWMKAAVPSPQAQLTLLEAVLTCSIWPPI